MKAVSFYTPPYQQHGSLKEVRIVTYRNGSSKGLAYVEYETEVGTLRDWPVLDLEFVILHCVIITNVSLMVGTVHL